MRTLYEVTLVPLPGGFAYTVCISTGDLYWTSALIGLDATTEPEASREALARVKALRKALGDSDEGEEDVNEIS